MLKKMGKRLFTALALAGMLATAAGCAGGTKNENEILIGVLVPTSGTEAYYGNDMLQSYQLACDEINAAGGVLGKNLVLYQADDGANPDMASQAAAKIIAKKPDFVVGGYSSGATIPTLQQFFDAKLVTLISAANSTEITKLGLNQTFMINSPGNHAAVTVTDLCKFLGTTKAALIHQGDSYTKDLSDLCAAALPAAGIEVVSVQVMEKGAPDVSAIVTAIRNSGADFVYWCGYHSDGSNVIKQLRQGGYTGEIAVGDGSASPELITACGTAGENVYVTSPPFVEFANGGEKFITDYTAKYKMGPGNYATLCYDTIYLLKQAIEAAGSTDFAAVRDQVAAARYEGLSGVIEFTASRELKDSNFIVLQIVNGKFELVSMQ